MKNFFRALMAVVAFSSMVSMTSCSGDNDEIIPEEEKQEEKPTYNKVPAYCAYLTGDVLDLFDVKVVVYKGEKTKEVTFTKDNGVLDNHPMVGKAYYYTFLGIDNMEGIDKAIATVTPKSNIKTYLESLPADKVINLAYSSTKYDALVNPKDNSVNNENRHFIDNIEPALPSDLLIADTNGTTVYEAEAKMIGLFLTIKN